jgi:hypothetical protein
MAGGGFIYLLLLFSKYSCHNNPLMFFFIVTSGGYMQLFFGDMENYTLTAVLIFAYLFASYKYLNRRASLLLPSSLLALAITFHLLSFFLLPSLVYLYFLALQKKAFKDIYLSFFVFIIIIVFTLVFFHFNGLPIQNLYYHSHAFGHGGHISDMLVNPSWNYYGGILSLFSILIPSAIPFFLVILKKVKFDEMNIYLTIASFSMIVYMLLWKAGLGIYDDWNLFANVAIPISVFVGRNTLRSNFFEGKTDVLLSILLLFYIQTYSRIIYNHFV